MIKRSSQTLCIWFIFCDAFMTVSAWLLAYVLRYNARFFPTDKPTPDFSLCLSNVPLVAVLALVGYRLAGMYEVHRLRRFREETVSVFKGVALMSLLVMATSFYTRSEYEPRGTIFMFSILSGIVVLASRRLSWGFVHRLRRQGYNQTHSIIVGTGRTARRTARGLRSASWMGIRNIGYVEDKTSRWSSDLHILGTVDDLPQLVEKYKVENVFIALPMNRSSEARKVFDVLSRTMVEVRMVADVPYLAGWTLTTTNLDGLPVIGLRESPHFGLNMWIKRAMDIVLSIFALIVLSLPMLAIAILVKLTSPGPILHWQERCGLNGKRFWMLKFRSMYKDAEKGTGAVMTAINDDRRTPLGKFLRKTSLDELPQFFNTLMGDMSVVGPRPERPEFIEEFSKTIPNYMARHCVKTGITGWAQVHGWRGNTSLRKRLQYDLYYITHWNPWLDLRILFLTVWKVLFHRHAY